MRTARCDESRWRYSAPYGLAGMLTAAAVLVLMRHDPGDGLAWAVAITSAAGWLPRRDPRANRDRPR